MFLLRHQGFGVLSVILANHAIKLLTSLFQDLQVEALHRVNPRTRSALKGVPFSGAALIPLLSSGVVQRRATSGAQHHGAEHFHPESPAPHRLCAPDKSNVHSSLYVLQKGAAVTRDSSWFFFCFSPAIFPFRVLIKVKNRLCGAGEKEPKRATSLVTTTTTTIASNSFCTSGPSPPGLHPPTPEEGICEQ